MDYLTLDFHYKGKQSLLDFRDENIIDKLDGVEGVTRWSGFVKFDGKKIYFYKLWFWYIIIKITEILNERKVFIKIFLYCKTRIYYEKLS